MNKKRTIRRKNQRKIKNRNKKYQFKIESIRNEIKRLGHRANPLENIELNNKNNSILQGVH